MSDPEHVRPRRLTDGELDIQQAGYHDFNAVESMACELRERRHEDERTARLEALLSKAKLWCANESVRMKAQHARMSRVEVNLWNAVVSFPETP